MCLAQVRGHSCSTYVVESNEEYDDEEDVVEVCVSDSDGPAETIKELGRIFDPSNPEKGQGDYCDWAAVHGAALVEELRRT